MTAFQISLSPTFEIIKRRLPSLLQPLAGMISIRLPRCR